MKVFCLEFNGSLWASNFGSWLLNQISTNAVNSDERPNEIWCDFLFCVLWRSIFFSVDAAMLIKKSPTIGMKTKVNLLKIYNLTEHVHCAPFISKAMNSIDWRQSFFSSPSFICADCFCWLLLVLMLLQHWLLWPMPISSADLCFRCDLITTMKSEIAFYYAFKRAVWRQPFYTLCGSLSYVLQIWQCCVVSLMFYFFFSFSSVFLSLMFMCILLECIRDCYHE